MGVSTCASRLPRLVMTIGKSVSATVKKRNSSPRSPKSRNMLQTATDNNPTATTIIVPIKGTRNLLIRVLIRLIFMSVLLALVRGNPFPAGHLPAYVPVGQAVSRSLRLSSSACRGRMHGVKEPRGLNRLSGGPPPVSVTGTESEAGDFVSAANSCHSLSHSRGWKEAKLFELSSYFGVPAYPGARGNVQQATFLNRDTGRGCRSCLPSKGWKRGGNPGMATTQTVRQRSLEKPLGLARPRLPHHAPIL